MPILLASGRHYALSTWLLVLIAVHRVVVIVGGTFTYSQVPLVFWPQEAFELSRNSYDKISRFMQGLMLTPVAR